MLREWRGTLTQREAAKRLGLSWRTYCRWEAEGVPDGLAEVVRLALLASNPAAATTPQK